MLDFDEEISRFKPSLEVGQVEEAIRKESLTDVSDVMLELLKAKKE